MLQLGDRFKGATLMSRGLGRIETAIIDLLKANQHLSSRLLAVFVYQNDETLESGGRPPSRAESSTVRRALASLQAKQLIIKIGHLFHGERCSYATPENAIKIAQKYVEGFGTQGLSEHPALLRVYVDHVAAKASSKPDQALR